MCLAAEYLAYLLLNLLSLSALLACVCSVCVYCLPIFKWNHFTSFRNLKVQNSKHYARSKSHISESYSTQPYRRFEFGKKKKTGGRPHSDDQRSERLHADDEQPHLRFIQQTAIPSLRIWKKRQVAGYTRMTSGVSGYMRMTSEVSGLARPHGRHVRAYV